MTLEPLLQAGPAIQLHVLTVIPAFVLGTWQLFASRKGARPHRLVGWIYLALMSLTAFSTLFIHAEIGPTFMGFGLIHLFVPLTAWSVYTAIAGARAHDIRRHRAAMIGLYVGAILVAGAFTFLPGRIMHRMIFA